MNPTNAPTVPPAQPFCTACGTRNPGDARFCFRCGTPLVVDSGVSTMPVTSGRNSLSAGSGHHTGEPLNEDDVDEGVDQEGDEGVDWEFNDAFPGAGNRPKSVLHRDIVSDAKLRSGCLSIVMWGGFLGALYFLTIFDVSVQTPTGRVTNIGLMNDRQNYLLFCGGVAVVALILKLTSRNAD